jgi:hypothetical protein
MATKNDITGDSLTSKSPTKAYDEGWDRIFKKKSDLESNSEFAHPAYTRYPHLKEKDFKAVQQDHTELNGDGNRDRGRYGEDLSSEK